jgi:NADPH:quinone reductase-like Zn-dependent oxidoreductase
VREPRNRVVQVRRFGGPDGLEVVDAPLPTVGRSEVRVRVRFRPLLRGIHPDLPRGA